LVVFNLAISSIASIAYIIAVASSESAIRIIIVPFLEAVTV
jgi:hypothetical protein